VNALLRAEPKQIPEVIAAHPVLLEMETITALTAFAEKALADGNQPLAVHASASLYFLFDAYSRQQGSGIEPAAHRAYIDLIGRTLVIIEGAASQALADALKESRAHAYTILGSYHENCKEHEAAVEAYTGALADAPYNAMYLRNRANAYINMRAYDKAKPDIVRAELLQSNAPYLAERWFEYCLGINDLEMMMQRVTAVRERVPNEPLPHFYEALSYVWRGDQERAAASMRESNRLASGEQRAQELKLLSTFKEQHSDQAEHLEALVAILGEVQSTS
jgi:tetratricopeptide (TPR) repeat protein